MMPIDLFWACRTIATRWSSSAPTSWRSSPSHGAAPTSPHLRPTASSWRSSPASRCAGVDRLRSRPAADGRRCRPLTPRVQRRVEVCRETLEHPIGVERTPGVRAAPNEDVVPPPYVHRQAGLGRVPAVVRRDQRVHLAEVVRLGDGTPAAREESRVAVAGDQPAPARAAPAPRARRSSTARSREGGACTEAGRRAMRCRSRRRAGNAGAEAAMGRPASAPPDERRACNARASARCLGLRLPNTPLAEQLLAGARVHQPLQPANRLGGQRLDQGLRLGHRRLAGEVLADVGGRPAVDETLAGEQRNRAAAGSSAPSANA